MGDFSRVLADSAHRRAEVAPTIAGLDLLGGWPVPFDHCGYAGSAIEDKNDEGFDRMAAGRARAGEPDTNNLKLNQIVFH